MIMRTRALAIAGFVTWTLMTTYGRPQAAAQAPSPPATTEQPAAEQTATPTAPTLMLSSDLQGAGSTAVISLTLRMPEGVSVGRAVSEVAFPKQFLQFHNATRGLSTEAAEGKIEVVPQPDKGDQSVVQIVATAKAGETLPAGSLAELRFRILRGAKVDSKLVLAITASAWADAAGTTPLAPVVARNGEVKVTKTTLLPACFFYMH
jgi:hypothetical protein